MVRVRRSQLCVLTGLSLAVATLVAFAQDETTGQGNETIAQTEQGELRFKSARRIKLQTPLETGDIFSDLVPVAMRGYKGKLFLLFHEVRVPAHVRTVMFEAVDLVRGKSEQWITFNPSIAPSEISPTGRYVAAVAGRRSTEQTLVGVWEVTNGTVKTFCELRIPTKTLVPPSPDGRFRPWTVQYSTPEFIDDNLLALVMKVGESFHYVVYRLSESSGERVYSLASQIRPVLAPDRKQLAIVQNDHVVIVDPRTGEQLKTLRGEIRVPATLAFHPSGAWLAAFAKEEYRVWDVRAGLPALYTTGGHAGGTWGVWLYDKFIFLGDEGGVELIDARIGTRIRIYAESFFNSVEARVQSYAWHPFHAGLYWYPTKAKFGKSLFLVGVPLPDQKARAHAAQIDPDSLIVFPVGSAVRLVVESKTLTDEEKAKIKERLRERFAERRISVTSSGTPYEFRVSAEQVGTQMVQYYLLEREADLTQLFTSGSLTTITQTPVGVSVPLWEVKLSLKRAGTVVWEHSYSAAFRPSEIDLDRNDTLEDAKEKVVKAARARAPEAIAKSRLPVPSKLREPESVDLGTRAYGVIGLY